MIDKTIEGIWEEVASRGHELAGHRVRVTVLDLPTSPVNLAQMLAPLLREAEIEASELPPIEDASLDGLWGEGVLEKFRRQGLSP